MDVRPEVSNVRGDSRAPIASRRRRGRSLAYELRHEQASVRDLRPHHSLSVAVVVDARAIAWIVAGSIRTFVLQVEVTDVGRDNKLAASRRSPLRCRRSLSCRTTRQRVRNHAGVAPRPTVWDNATRAPSTCVNRTRRQLGTSSAPVPGPRRRALPLESSPHSD